MLHVHSEMKGITLERRELPSIGCERYKAAKDIAKSRTVYFDLMAHEMGLTILLAYFCFLEVCSSTTGRRALPYPEICLWTLLVKTRYHLP